VPPDLPFKARRLRSYPAAWANLYLLLIPLLPDITAGRVETEQGPELSVRLAGLATLHEGLNQERPRLE
jgi:hypothetical protein